MALAVLAVALAALVQAASGNAANAAHLRDKTFATWVAHNQIAQWQLARDWPSTGTRKGSSELANHEWFWQAVINDTPEEDMRRVEISVYPDSRARSDALSLVTVYGFLPRPATAVTTQ